MKKVINGKVYDTTTAKELAIWSNIQDVSDFRHFTETLYQKRTGEYFLHGEGGPMTRYAISCGSNSWSGGAKIIPLTAEDARKWAEKNLDGDDYERIFGLPDEEDDAKTTLCIQLPAALAARIRARAAEDGTSVAACIAQLLEKAL